MITKRPLPVTTASILLVLIIVFTFASSLLSMRGITPGGPGGGFQPPAGMRPPTGSQPPSGLPNLPRPGASAGNSIQTMFILICSVAVVGILATLVAAWGLWRLKTWGMILSVVVAALIVLGSIVTSGILPIGRGLLWPTIVCTLMAVAVIVLVFLPVSRRAFAMEAQTQKSVV